MLFSALRMNRPFVLVLILVLVLDWPTRFSRTRTTTRTIQFMVPMRGGKTVEASHEPQKVAQASCLFGADRLEACPTLQPAARFMVPTRGGKTVEACQKNAPVLSGAGGRFSLSQGERAGVRASVHLAFLSPMNFVSSRREEAPINFGFRISDF